MTAYKNEEEKNSYKHYPSSSIADRLKNAEDGNIYTKAHLDQGRCPNAAGFERMAMAPGDWSEAQLRNREQRILAGEVWSISPKDHHTEAVLFCRADRTMEWQFFFDKAKAEVACSDGRNGFNRQNNAQVAFKNALSRRADGATKSFHRVIHHEGDGRAHIMRMRPRDKDVTSEYCSLEQVDEKVASFGDSIPL